MNQHLHIDCIHGISGDMFMAAMADLGLDLKKLENIFNRAGLDLRLSIRPDKRCGIVGQRFQVDCESEQPLRNLEDILNVLDKLDCARQIREKAAAAFRRLAEVEAAIHGTSPLDVHFHETGAVDTVVDILGAFWAVEELGIKEVSASPLPWCSGRVQCAHGLLPLPAPATAILMQDKPIGPLAFDFEAVTPTGALIMDQLVHDFRTPEGCLQRSGLGFGKIDNGFNGLRAFIFAGRESDRDWIWVLESNIDHLSGEEIGVFIEELQEAGALDAVYYPGVMKKNRPGGMLQVIALSGDVRAVRTAFFRNSLTLGIREQLVRRRILRREREVRRTVWGEVQGKAFYVEGRKFWRPEMDDVRRKAKRANVSVAEFLNGMKEASPDGSS
ncbi:MAG: LarC family nickel insertion protein [Thermodesulfobacteriota bacterium]